MRSLSCLCKQGAITAIPGAKGASSWSHLPPKELYQCQGAGTRVGAASPSPAPTPGSVLAALPLLLCQAHLPYKSQSEFRKERRGIAFSRLRAEGIMGSLFPGNYVDFCVGFSSAPFQPSLWSDASRRNAAFGWVSGSKHGRACREDAGAWAPHVPQGL